MKTKDIVKAIVAILVPGAIPAWIGYKIYEQYKKRKN